MAELVVIAKPNDLRAAINHAEHIEMARNFASGNIPGQKSGTPLRGRGGFMRGRGRFNAVQASGSSYHGHHLSTCTNELFGEDLCAEMNGCELKGMRSLPLNADCALGSDELHWCVV